MERQTPHIDGLVQCCCNSIANSLELLQSCTKPSIYRSHFVPQHSIETHLALAMMHRFQPHIGIYNVLCHTILRNLSWNFRHDCDIFKNKYYSFQNLSGRLFVSQWWVIKLTLSQAGDTTDKLYCICGRVSPFFIASYPQRNHIASGKLVIPC